MDFQIKCAGSANVSINLLSKENGIERYEMKAVYPEKQTPEQLTVTFAIPNKEVYSVWSPSIRYDRHIGPAWNKRTSISRLAFMMPLHVLVSADGNRRWLADR